MSDLRIPMTDHLVDAMGDLSAVELYDLHTAASEAAGAIDAVLGYPRCTDALQEILEQVGDFLRRIADNAASMAPEAEATTDHDRDRKAELMLRHLFDHAEPGLLAASAAAVAASLAAGGKVDAEFYCAGGWKRANDPETGEVRT
ncbi:hypothetical protein ABIE65_004897 [Constrictibacter sp. MBR-5]|jgi:hypothetical protein|uniref:hypothetical protein n=1 Tax=Constrictibacter sp. MBR-5 TaxID=3156467 RepID=UPI0033923D60